MDFFENKGGTFKLAPTSKELMERKGWWNSITETDINNDGLPDYLLGNLGLNSKYSTNYNNPITLYAGDFDDNGSWDNVFSTNYRGNYVPLRGRECSSNQMPFIAKKFPTYDLFAKATIHDIYGKKLEQAHKFIANDFSSIFLFNEGEGIFTIKELPVEAQIAPILDAAVFDINNDGYNDIIAVGTIFNTEVETPRLDMGSGIILLSNKNDGFIYDINLNRKLRLKGNLKSIEKIIIDKKDYMIVGRNNNSPLFLKIN